MMKMKEISVDYLTIIYLGGDPYSPTVLKTKDIDSGVEDFYKVKPSFLNGPDLEMGLEFHEICPLCDKEVLVDFLFLEDDEYEEMFDDFRLYSVLCTKCGKFIGLKW